MSVSSFTVYYEGPFWVGVFERHDAAGLSVGRHVFGAEPSEAELRRFLDEDLAWLTLSRPQPGPATGPAAAIRDGGRAAGASAPPNAKRAIRQARREQRGGPDRYTHCALQAALGEAKAERRARSRQQREAEEAELQAKRLAKRKKRARGH